MTHNELLDKIYWYWRRDLRGADGLQPMTDYRRALLAVVELHQPKWVLLKVILEGTKPDPIAICSHCSDEPYRTGYPCETIQVIEKELR